MREPFCIDLRERYLSDEDRSLHESSEEKMCIIRIMLIVTLIMEKIRRLDRSSKERLRFACDAVAKYQLVDNKQKQETSLDF